MPYQFVEVASQDQIDRLPARWRVSSLQKILFFNLASSLTLVGSSLSVDRSTVTNSCTLTDAQRYRLGVNYQTIPVRNTVLCSKCCEAYSRSNI